MRTSWPSGRVDFFSLVLAVIKSWKEHFLRGRFDHPWPIKNFGIFKKKSVKISIYPQKIVDITAKLSKYPSI